MVSAVVPNGKSINCTRQRQRTNSMRRYLLPTLLSLLFTILIGIGATTLTEAQISRPKAGLTIIDAGPITTNPPFTLVETFLAVNPTDPNNLLASAMSTTTDSSVVYATWDGGSTWQKVQNGNNGVFPGGDPMLAFDGNGGAYFSTITPAMTVWRSTDRGRTWSDSVKVPGEAHDRQWIAASHQPDDKTLPVYGTAKMSNEKGEHLLITTRSLDGAQSFSKPEATPIQNRRIHAPSDLLVRDNGTILVSYLAYHGYENPGSDIVSGERLILISKDNGQTWAGPFKIGEKRAYGNRVQDFSLVSKGLESPALAVDKSGCKFDGSIYTTWTTIIDGHLQVVAAYSRDGGRTWSDPVRVNSGGKNSDHSTTMSIVNSKGVVGVAWSDRRNDPKDECFQQYIAISRDGGQTFSTDKKISDRKTCPNSERFINGGDTQGLVALPNGDFRVTWPVGSKDHITIWTALARPGPKNK